MMNKIELSTILLFFLFAFATNAQQIDTRTQNQVKAKFAMANEYYNEGNYSDALEKIVESEELLKGALLPSLLDLKVKILISKKEFQQAKDVLYILEGLELSSEIIQNIGDYSDQIEDGLEKELMKKSQQAIDAIYFKNTYYEQSLRNENLAEVIVVDASKSCPSNNGKAFISKDGLITLKCGEVWYGSFAENGLSLFQSGNRKGYVNTKGEVMFEYRSSSKVDYSLHGFTDMGVAVVSESRSGMEVNGKDKEYLIDKDNRIVYVAPNRNSVSTKCLSYSGEGMVLISDCNYGSFSFYNLNTNSVGIRTYEWVTRFVNGYANVTYQGQKWIINNKEDLLIKLPTNTKDVEQIKHDMFVVKLKDGKKGVLSSSGEIVIPYDNYHEIIILSDKYIRVQTGSDYDNHTMGIYTTEGTVFFENIYWWINMTEDNQFVVYPEKGRCSLKNELKEDITYIDYTNIYTSISEDRRIVKYGDKFGFIDENCSKKVDYKYDKVKSYKDGLAVVMENGKWGVIDINGKEMVPCIYDEISYFFDGTAVAELNGKKILIDSNGNKVL